MRRDLNHKESGGLGERLTAYYLEKSGYEILGTNYRIKGGEIDVVSKQGETVAFTEVKTREYSAIEQPAYFVGKTKQQLIIKAAYNFVKENFPGCRPRFDVAEVFVTDGKAVRLRYTPDAFGTGEG